MRSALLIVLLLIVGCYLMDNDASANMSLTDKKGDIGKVKLTDTPKGLFVEVDLKNLPSGEHGFHIHEYGSCEDGTDEKGVLQKAFKAGGHFDPEKTGKHLGPKGKGHKGDLPVLKVDKKGNVKVSFYVPDLMVKEVRERAIIIHEGKDNYKDTPLPLGGGGKRIACGVIR